MITSSIPIDLLQSDIPLPLGTYASANDRVKHMRAVEQLADDINRPAAEIQILYEDILMQMQGSAKITDYLPILVSKRIMRLLGT